MTAIAFGLFLFIAADWALGVVSLCETPGSWTRKLVQEDSLQVHLYGFFGVFAALRLCRIGLRGRRVGGRHFGIPWFRLFLYWLILLACAYEAGYPSTRRQFEANVNAEAVRRASALGLQITHWDELPDGPENPKTGAIKHWARTQPLDWTYGYSFRRLLGLYPVFATWLLALLAELATTLWRRSRRKRAMHRA